MILDKEIFLVSQYVCYLRFVNELVIFYKVH